MGGIVVIYDHLAFRFFRGRVSKFKNVCQPLDDASASATQNYCHTNEMRVVFLQNGAAKALSMRNFFGSLISGLVIFFFLGVIV